MRYEEILTRLRNRSVDELRSLRAQNKAGETTRVLSHLGIAELPCPEDHYQHNTAAHLGQVIREKTEVRKSFLRRRVFYYGVDECDQYHSDFPSWERKVPRYPVQVSARQLSPNSDWWWDNQPFCIRLGFRCRGRWHHWSFMFGGKTRP